MPDDNRPKDPSAAPPPPVFPGAGEEGIIEEREASVPTHAAEPELPTAGAAHSQAGQGALSPGADEDPFADDERAVAFVNEAYHLMREELGKVIVGQSHVVDQVLISIFTRTHSLLVGVPGLAKTLLISTLAKTLALDFKRIQFTPDLMPSDITGTEVMFQDPQTGEREFRFLKGPIFANIVLADEINRTPPKTQAAMLEAMQERKVSIGGKDHPLPKPFFVLATQNPVDQEGTYTLPEAQLDRFMFLIKVDYPSTEEEIEIMKRASSPIEEEVEPVLDEATILAIQKFVKTVPVADHVFSYCEKLVRMTRVRPDADKNDWAKKWLSWGAGPRASLNLVLAAQAHAILQGNFYVSCEDVAAVAEPILRHRIVPNFAAQSEGVTSEDLIGEILETVPKA